jgi:hypothetical protein
MHKIKSGLRHQDLEGISFRFSWKLKKLCRLDFFVFELWQTAVKSQGKTITSSAVCHDSKTKKLSFPLKRLCGAKKIPPIWWISVDDVTVSPL